MGKKVDEKCATCGHGASDHSEHGRHPCVSFDGGYRELEDGICACSEFVLKSGSRK